MFVSSTIPPMHSSARMWWTWGRKWLETLYASLTQFDRVATPSPDYFANLGGRCTNGRIVVKLRQFNWLSIFDNRGKWHNLGTILRGTVSATGPGWHGTGKPKANRVSSCPTSKHIQNFKYIYHLTFSSRADFTCVNIFINKKWNVIWLCEATTYLINVKYEVQFAYIFKTFI